MTRACCLLEPGTGGVSALPGFKEGAWWVQDAAAATPATVLMSALRAQVRAPGFACDDSRVRVLDMCAAPGGKCAQLAGLGGCSEFASSGLTVEVTAVDVDARRVQTMRANLHRIFGDACPVRSVVGDGRSLDVATLEAKGASKGASKGVSAGFAGALLDVPCSATGTGRRRPDVLRKALPPTPRALREASRSCDGGRDESSDVAAARDFRGLLELQAALAEQCARFLVRPGGVLVYASCSLLLEEGEGQAAALARLTDESGAPLLSPLPITAGEVPGFGRAVTREGWLRVLPGCLDDLCDGFFVARFTRRGAG